MSRQASALERRVLVLTPTGKDAWLTVSLLAENGIAAQQVPNLGALIEEMAVGVGVVLIAEEAIAYGESTALILALAQQPPWSDLPLLVLTRQGADSPAVVEALHTLGNVSLVERPTRLSALVSAVLAALRARQKQYQIRDYLIERDQAAAHLRDTDRRKDEFLAILAHELRNPMAPIANAITVLRLMAGRNPEIARICAMMERQVHHMVRLVDDLLDVSRITRGKVELRRQPLDLAVVLHSAIETVQPLITARVHRLMVDLPATPLPLNADLVRLSQVFSNLLNNAAKYMNEGGCIWLSARAEGDLVRVSVKDAGIGIPAEHLSGIFNMFTQVRRGRDHAQGGLGIGLTLVKSLVQMHGGTIEARSEGPGRGSEFIVTLPLAPAASPAPPSEPTEAVKMPETIARKVLVVDDNQDAATTLGLLLEVLGAQVRVVHDGPDALRAFETHRPDLVLLDLGMPGMDGLEVARRMRELPGGKGAVLVALTGWGGDEDRRRTREEGFDHHLTKPLEMPVLEKLLHTLDADAEREVAH